MRRVFVALLMIAAAAAQPAHVAGRVVKQTGEGMRHATVTLLGAERYTATADAAGAFAFDGVAPGTYALMAQRVGYASQKYGAAWPLVRACGKLDDVNNQREHANSGYDVVVDLRQCIEHAPGTMLTLAVGQAIKDLTIPIVQHGVISGKVLNQDGEATANQVVAAMREVYRDGARRLAQAVSTSTGPDGVYTLDDLPPGRYYVRAMTGYTFASPGRDKAPQEADVQTYYPSEMDASKAAPVEVKAGEESGGTDILLRRMGVFTVRGTVALPPGGPASNIYVSLTAKALDGMPTGARLNAVAANGAFEIRGVLPGGYVISSARLGGSSPLLVQRQDVVVSGDVEGLSLSPLQGVAVTGTMKMEGPMPQDWPTVTLAAPHGTPDPLLPQIADAYSGAGPVKPDANGTISFPIGLAPSEYEVQITGLPAGTYVKSIRYGEQDALHEALDLTGGGAGSLDIVLSSKGAAITGKAAAGALVTAWPKKTEFAGGVHSASADQNGNFAIGGLGPGDYFVAAWEDIDPGLAEDAGFLARFQGDAAAVSLAEGGRGVANVKAIGRERVAAEVAKLP